MTKRIIFYSAIVIVFVLALASFLFWRSISVPNEQPGREVSFTVSRGETIEEIGENLYQRGLIGSKFVFKVFVRLNQSQIKLQAGEYELSSTLSLREIVSTLASGRFAPRKLLVKEGERLEDIALLLEQEGFFGKDEFFSVTGQPLVDYRASADKLSLPLEIKNKYSFLSDKPEHYGLEGYLFPDTYLFARNVSPEQVVDKLLDNFDNKLTPEMRRDIAVQGKTVFEIVTIASILEKEVRTPEDMKIAAGLFWNRLERGQALQSDATLSYALKDKTAAHSGEDLELDSPYNSYKHKGLPPTPICNPGLNALMAAIYPTPTDYVFFLTTPEGKTIFSRTFEEHKLNKARYLK